MTYYNDNDPHACRWLAELCQREQLPFGHIDQRSIKDVQPSDLASYQQCHFFAGIGGWPYALKLAGWPDEWPVWTGSCPCQPFSCAGKGAGVNDPRHLWPEFYRLICQCKPPVIFGEQVASKAGREWLAGVRTDLEALGYAIGAADLCAASAGAPHIRQRIIWVAYAAHHRLSWEQATWSRRAGTSHSRLSSVASWSNYEPISFQNGKTRRVESGTFPLAHGIPNRVGLLRGYGNAIVPQVGALFISAFMDFLAQQ